MQSFQRRKLLKSMALIGALALCGPLLLGRPPILYYHSFRAENFMGISLFTMNFLWRLKYVAPELASGH